MIVLESLQTANKIEMWLVVFSILVRVIVQLVFLRYIIIRVLYACSFFKTERVSISIISIT